MSYQVINHATGEVAAAFETNSDNLKLAINLADRLAADDDDPEVVWTVVELVAVHEARKQVSGDGGTG